MQYKLKYIGGEMKIAVGIIVAAIMLADAFLMWCLLRANALYERNKGEYGIATSIDGEKSGKQNDANQMF